MLQRHTLKRHGQQHLAPQSHLPPRHDEKHLQLQHHQTQLRDQQYVHASSNRRRAICRRAFSSIASGRSITLSSAWRCSTTLRGVTTSGC